MGRLVCGSEPNLTNARCHRMVCSTCRDEIRSNLLVIELLLLLLLLLRLLLVLATTTSTYYLLVIELLAALVSTQLLAALEQLAELEAPLA